MNRGASARIDIVGVLRSALIAAIAMPDASIAVPTDTLTRVRAHDDTTIPRHVASHGTHRHRLRQKPKDSLRGKPAPWKSRASHRAPSETSVLSRANAPIVAGADGADAGGAEAGVTVATGESPQRRLEVKTLLAKATLRPRRALLAMRPESLDQTQAIPRDHPSCRSPASRDPQNWSARRMVVRNRDPQSSARQRAQAQANQLDRRSLSYGRLRRRTPPRTVRGATTSAPQTLRLRARSLLTREMAEQAACGLLGQIQHFLESRLAAVIRIRHIVRAEVRSEFQKQPHPLAILDG